MHCDNCGPAERIAFTLTTHADGGPSVELRFCSAECLSAWTSPPADRSARRMRA